MTKDALMIHSKNERIFSKDGWGQKANHIIPNRISGDQRPGFTNFLLQIFLLISGLLKPGAGRLFNYPFNMSSLYKTKLRGISHQMAKCQFRHFLSSLFQHVNEIFCLCIQLRVVNRCVLIINARLSNWFGQRKMSIKGELWSAILCLPSKDKKIKKSLNIEIRNIGKH